MNQYVEKLSSHNKIVFGPSLMELGWEIMRWSGFITWYKKKYPKKEIAVVTRADRLDLYYNNVDSIVPINIEHDYEKYVPDMYLLRNFPDETYKMLIQKIKQQFKGYFIFETNMLPSSDKHIFDYDIMDFNYTPRIENTTTISNIIVDNINRIPIVISPRQRIDRNDRNWGTENWNKLFELIEKTNSFLVFISGKSPAYTKPNSQYKSFCILEDLVDDNTSLIGLTIEAIKRSSLTVGTQSAIPILSNLMKTPTLMWGHEKDRHQKNENIFDTKCIFVIDREYKVDPQLIFDYTCKLCSYKEGDIVKTYLDYGEDYYNWILKYKNMDGKEKGNLQTKYTEYLINVFPEIKQGKVLDYGCFLGSNTSSFIDNGIDTYGIDVSQWYLDNTPFDNLKEKLYLINKDETLPFPSDYFNFIHINNVIEHISKEKIINFIFQLHKILRPGGIVYINTVGKNDEDDPTKINCLSGVEWNRYFIKHGFQSVTEQYKKVWEKQSLYKLNMRGFQYVYKKI